ncbi:16S rRNA (cytidine(1402)-2'-O)-methyltransferase [Rhodobacteraceae bacterium RKSG542]|uniref:16S rRNA (cytidine(1402)-2'-O)-methyltransferase n=1 Tax=Pseudovibrio flavus TaxID=2529854 RepID=UPI0012BC71EA|nr:16S rRNA (cytidine(1402)-2'-O)-methyltransferase [Pseudovibrio flavus]MTI18533.1 16S rRNA (cytidine(1402)-2'-O)-methyltransferase [Pseudovibrio flavus]
MQAPHEKGHTNYSIGATTFEAKPIEAGFYIVSTPIGNLGDITIRALETLAASDLIACEDTRVTGGLLHRFGIRTQMIPYHEHNGERQRPRIEAALAEGKIVSLVSDAGTPLISDPGYQLVRALLEAGHKVVPIPGASAMLTGIVASGLPSDMVVFAGFLPHKSGARRKRLEELSEQAGTLVLYESPHRVGSSLGDMAQILGPDREAVVARELTKKFEEFKRGTLRELASLFSENTVKGELVIMIAPGEKRASETLDISALLRESLQTMPVSAAAKHVAKLTGGDRKLIYARALELKQDAEFSHSGDAED